MYCTNCGKEIDNTISFCPYCGTRVTKAESQEYIERKQAHDAWRAQMSQRLGQSSATDAPPIAPEEIPEPDYSSPPPIPPTEFMDAPAKGPSKKAKKPIFKRWWFWVIAIIVALMVIGSGGEESDNNNDPVDLRDQENIVTDATSALETQITESVVYNENGVKITVTGLNNYSIWGKEIKLLVENNTGKNIAVSGDNFIINGITVPGFMYVEVAAGKKSNDSIQIYSDSLSYAGIAEIATLIAVDSHIVNTDTYDTICEAPFSVKSSIADTYTQKIDESGTLLYEHSGVRVVAQVITDSIFGKTVRLFVDNTSTSDLIIEAENVSVNGFTTSAWMYDNIYAGTVRYCDLDLYSSGLEENNIEKIEEVTFTIKLINPNSYETIAKSQELLVSVGD